MKWGQIVFGIFLAIVISAGTIFSLYGDWLWYNAIGYHVIFSTIIVNSIKLGAAAMVGFFSLGYLGNILIVFVADLSVLLIVEALVFLVGAIFVLLVFNLSFKTYELIYEIL